MDQQQVDGGSQAQQQQQQQQQRSARSISSPATHGQFMGDEFRAYMSRKIELQRKQFGLVLPPAPPSPAAAPVPKTASPPSSRKKVRFSEQQSSPPSAHSNGGLSGVLSRLQKKHGLSSGRGGTSTSSSRKRRRQEGREGGYDDSRGSSSFADGSTPRKSVELESSRSSEGSAGDPKDEPTRSTPCMSESSTKKSLPRGEQMATRRSRPDLFFLGVVVLINGYTSPDTPTLTRMLQKHGGDVEKYETSRVTHIIASTLSTAKALIYKRRRNPTPYVRPEWIVDSCREGKLLPYADYFLDEMKDDNVGTKTVKSFFAASPASSARNINTSISAKANSPKNSADDPRQKRGADSSTTGGTGNRVISARSFGLTRTVGTDPDFLDSYFKNSRLSFIGSFKQRMKNVGDNSPTRRSRTTKNERFVFHVDIDCFFAAVALRRYPQYRNMPVAIGHGWKTDSQGRPVRVGEGHASQSSNDNQGGKKSYSELSTCNYNARKYGVKKGMFLHQAKRLCPDLIVLPYDYEGYEEVSSLVSDILHHQAEKFEGAVEQVSCDEAYIEMFLSQEDAENEDNRYSNFAKKLAEEIRTEINAATECTASIGVGENKFLAKLATDKAKPDGSFVVMDCYDLLYGLRLRDLPGIGWKLDRKLQENNLETVRDVLALGDDAKAKLCSIIGESNGQKMLDYIDGKDNRPVQAAERKTIGAECNYGVRFDGPYGPDYMIEGLSKEVSRRMEGIGVRGAKKLTLKIMQRKEGAKAPAKFLGHGSCNSLSKTCDLAGNACDWTVISRAAFALFNDLTIDKVDIRGMGVVLSKLMFDDDEEDAGAANMSSWLKGAASKKKSTCATNEAAPIDDDKASKEDDITAAEAGATAENVSSWKDDDIYDLPSLSQIDNSILVQLPKDIQESVRQSSFKRKGNDDALVCRSTNELQEEDPVENDNNASFQAELSSNEQAEGELALPPLSQIDRNEVEALPTPLREEILKQIRSKEASKTSPVAARSPNTRSPTSYWTRGRNHRKSTAGDFHLRQMSVKRMLKLASVKNSGHDDSISLTQLDTLPLELQLQIANNDEAPLCGRRVGQIAETCVHPKDAPNEDTFREEEKVQSSQDMAQVDEIDPEEDFYHSNVVPLTDWLDAHPIPSSDEVEHVKDFFFTLILEKSLDEVVHLLRVIKRRPDEWGKAQLEILVDSVDDRLVACQGRRLDRRNL